MSEEPKVIELNIAYHPSPYPQAMRNDLIEMAEVCDGLYVITTEADVQYCPRKITHCIDIAHELNLVTVLVMPGYGNLFETLGSSSVFTAVHPQLNCITNTGRAIPKSCPNKPEVGAFLSNTVQGLSSTFEADGFLWNMPSWALPSHLGALAPEEWLCHCPDCVASFESQYQMPMPNTLTPEVEEFRTQTITDCLTTVCQQVKACGNHLITSVRLGAHEQRLLSAAQNESLDVLGVDICWRPSDELCQKDLIEQSLKNVVRISHQRGMLSEAWLCTWGMHTLHEGDIYRAAKYAAAQGIDCLNAWSYRDEISFTPVDAPHPADASLVWAELRRAYYEIRNGDFDIYPYD